MPTTTENIKDFLKTIVKTAYPIASTSTNLSENSSIMRNLPIVGIRAGAVTSLDSVFGRLTPELGDYEIYNFTLNCLASNCISDNYSKDKYVNDMSDSIVKYMKQNRSAFKINEIYDIYDISSRESQPNENTAFNISRNIITGKLLVKNKD